jgi:hypothetical protein
MTKIALIKEAARHLASFLNYCDQSRVDASLGKRNMAFWCLEMASTHRRKYAILRAAIKSQG